MKTILKITGVMYLLLTIVSCKNKNLNAVSTSTSGDYTIILLTDRDYIKQGKGTMYVEFRKTNDNRPVDVGNVQLRAEMPMPGMPMTHEAEVEKTDQPGRYEVNYNFEMSGSWTLTIKFDTDKTAVISITVG